MRKAEVTRNTTETKIHLQLTIDGTGQQSIKTGVGFRPHAGIICPPRSL